MPPREDDMTRLKFHWFLPTNGGDGRQVVGGGHGVSAGTGGRPASVGYLGGLPELARRGPGEDPAPVASSASVPFGSSSEAAS
jgi:hypothetical protein